MLLKCQPSSRVVSPVFAMLKVIGQKSEIVLVGEEVQVMAGRLDIQIQCMFFWCYRSNNLLD